MLADIASNLTDDQVEEFMSNENVIEAFENKQIQPLNDQADFLTGIDNWDNDFKDIVFKLFEAQ